MKNKLYKKLFLGRMWGRIYLERLGEPFIYNIVSLFVFLFGTYRKKIAYDLIPRQSYACGIDLACRTAKRFGINKLAIIEFGVAGGGGLLNMISIADHLKRETGIEFKVIGFDTGSGMPDPTDFRDHPEQYNEGDIPMYNQEALIKSLPFNAKLYLGDVGDRLVDFFNEFPPDYKIGFISIDLDYYSSTKKALEVLKGDADKYLPFIPMYFDDVNDISHNEYCGELLAIKEFNQDKNEIRKITKLNQLKVWRLFKHPFWLDRMYMGHIFDSKSRRPKVRNAIILDNPYLNK